MMTGTRHTMTSHNRLRDIDSGWAWTVLFAVYCGVAMISTTAYMSGVLYVTLLDCYHDDKAKTTFVVSLNSGLLCLLGPVVSFIVNRYSCRIAMVTGGVVLSVSCLCSAFVRSIDTLIVIYGVFGGIGNALVGTPLAIVLGFYFNKHRNFVISMSFSMVGIGIFAATPFAMAIVDTYGLRGTFLILSAFNAHLCVVGVICKPSLIEMKLHNEKQMSTYNEENVKEYDIGMEKHENPEQKKRNLTDKFNNTVMKRVDVVLFLYSTLSWNLTLAVCVMHLPNYLTVKGTDDVEIAVIMTCFSAGNMAGRFFTPFTVDRKRIDIFIVHIVMLAIGGVVTLSFPFYSSQFEGGDYAFSVAIGFLTGGPNALMTPITLRLVGLEKLSAAHGLSYFFCGLGFVIGPPTAGALFGQTGSYGSSFYFSGAVLLAGSCAALIAFVKERVSDAAPSSTLTEIEPSASDTAQDNEQKQTLL